MSKVKEDRRPMGEPNIWSRTHGGYIVGQAAIDGADVYAVQMEQKWGCGRLRLLVDNALREKFDRQRYLYNSSIWHGDLETLRREAARMVNAWTVLDLEAEAAGALPISPVVWEVTLANGTVAAVVRSPEEAAAVVKQDRRLVVYTMAEIGRLIETYYSTVEVKQAFPGAKVEKIRTEIEDPLDRIRDGYSLEQTLDDPIPDFGN